MAQNLIRINTNEYKKIVNFGVTYGTASTKFGLCSMGLHSDRICFLKFSDGSSSSFQDLKVAFPGAEFIQDDELVRKTAKQVFADSSGDLKITLKGTEFELSVWQELLNIRKGTTCSYEDIAKAIGNRKAVRAVANAIARNKVSYLIPCHRVISKDGSLNKYGGGVRRKLQLLKYENAM